MEKFKKALYGYDPKSVNIFVDKVIQDVENLIKSSKEKDKVIQELNQKLNYFNNIQENINKSLVMLQNTNKSIITKANEESSRILNHARKRANYIVNESMIKAKKLEEEIRIINKNVVSFKESYKRELENQIKVIDNIEVLDIDDIEMITEIENI